MLLAQGFEIGENNELIIPDDIFVEDEGWHEAAGRYGDFLAQHGIRAQGFFTADSREKVDCSYDGKVRCTLSKPQDNPAAAPAIWLHIPAGPYKQGNHQDLHSTA